MSRVEIEFPLLLLEMRLEWFADSVKVGRFYETML
jgi:hypothetical protein